MKKIRSLVKITMKVKMYYTKALWFNVIGMTVSILIYYYLWKYAFSSRDTLRGFTETEMVTYVILARILSTQFSGGVNKELSTWMYKGNILIELLRPISLEANVFSRKLGETCSFFLFQGFPMALASFLLLGGILPQSIISFAFFLISILCSVIILFWLEFIVGLCSIYTLNSNGISLAKGAIFSILSGGIVPISFFSEGLAQILELLPFSGMVSVPVNIYLSKYNELESICYIVLQIGWIFLLAIFGRMFFKRIIKKVIVQGG